MLYYYAQTNPNHYAYANMFHTHNITYMYAWPHTHTHTSLLTLLKWLSESGLTRHISVTRQTPVSSTPWFFSLSSCLMVGTYTSISSGTLRTIRTAHKAAYKYMYVKQRYSDKHSEDLRGMTIYMYTTWEAWHTAELLIAVISRHAERYRIAGNIGGH